MIDTFMARIEECARGKIVENHDLMKSFHERLARGEIDIHHHHAEFQPESEHSHGVYKHIAHPHGPRTMVDDHLCHCFMSQLPADSDLV